MWTASCLVWVTTTESRLSQCPYGSQRPVFSSVTLRFHSMFSFLALPSAKAPVVLVKGLLQRVAVPADHGLARGRYTEGRPPAHSGERRRSNSSSKIPLAQVGHPHRHILQPKQPRHVQARGVLKPGQEVDPLAAVPGSKGGGGRCSTPPLPAEHIPHLPGGSGHTVPQA